MNIETKAISRIVKLLNLSRDSGATEAEANLALEKAQELMRQANLTMAELEASGQSAGEEGVREKSDVVTKSPYRWHRDLMTQIAELNSCYCEIRFKQLDHTRQFDGYMLIGRQANVASTRVMFEYLIQTVERLGREWAGDKDKWFTTDAFNFKRGCADRVTERLYDRHRKAIAKQEAEAREAKARQSHPAAATSNAVVVVMREFYASEADLNNDMLRGWPPGTTAANRKKQEAASDAAAAARAAKRAQMEAQFPDESETVIDYLVWGYSIDRARELDNPTPTKPKPETDAQRKKRERREQRDSDRYWEQQRRASAYRHTAEYKAGRSAGEGVGLDKQADYDRKHRLG